MLLASGRNLSTTKPPRTLANKPIFIGVGENDTRHRPNGERATGAYKGVALKLPCACGPDLGAASMLTVRYFGNG